MAQIERGSARAFEKRLFWTTLAIAVSLVPALLIALRSLHAASEAQRNLNRNFVRTLSLVEDLRHQEALQDALAPVFVLTGDAAILRHIDQVRTGLATTVSALRRSNLSMAESAILDEVIALQVKLVDEEQPGFALRQSGQTISDVDNYFRQHAVPVVRSLNDRIADLRTNARNAYESRENGNEGAFCQAFYLLAGSLLVAILTMLVAAQVLFRTVLIKKAFDLEREQAAERAKTIAQARKEAVEVVAHDLKNPLSAIMLLAEQMSRGVRDARSERMLDGISSAAESMRLLILNLLDHAKIEAGPLALSMETGDVVPLLRTLAARYEVLGARKGVQVSHVLPVTLPAVEFDAIRLEQTFANLLGNAVKFTPSGGTVTLSGFEEAHRLVFAVADTGRGMDDNQVARVFERYWQAGETASWGTGLGLTIAKAVIDAHGGTIIVASARGSGSTFTVELPRVASDELAEGVAAQDDNARSLSRQRRCEVSQDHAPCCGTLSSS